ncbi:nicotinate-nucleotide pyrophosphorylase [Ligilactobacillus ruminis]|nr:nicotinate-nucleotide pyrophosphorylase [Ligilactobacillus ruminis]
MLKDNHIALAGSIKNCVENIRKHIVPLTPIEVEIETIDELKEAIDANVDVIMFDTSCRKQYENGKK